MTQLAELEGSVSPKVIVPIVTGTSRETVARGAVRLIELKSAMSSVALGMVPLSQLAGVFHVPLPSVVQVPVAAMAR
jgi:hypothetical protein